MKFIIFSRKEKLFGEYDDTFLKIKQESSGIPKHCMNANSEVDSDCLDRYIEEYKNAENILMDKENIKKNPALKTIAKRISKLSLGKISAK